MLTAARLDPVWHRSRAHRFFATTRWSQGIRSAPDGPESDAASKITVA
jgi:hypothetical protein